MCVKQSRCTVEWQLIVRTVVPPLLLTSNRDYSGSHLRTWQLLSYWVNSPPFMAIFARCHPKPDETIPLPAILPLLSMVLIGHSTCLHTSGFPTTNAHLVSTTCATSPVHRILLKSAFQYKVKHTTHAVPLQYFLLLRSEFYPLYHSQTSPIYIRPSLLRFHILLPHKTPDKAQFLWGLYFFNTKTTYTKICTQQLHTSLHLAINKAATLTQTLTQNLLVWA